MELKNLLLPSVVLSLVLLNAVQFSVCETIRFKLSAKYLPSMDVGGYNDPYVQVYSKDYTTRSYRKVAQTRIQHGTQVPYWPEVIEFFHIKGTQQKLKFMLKDWDFGWNQDDDLGRVEVYVDDVVDEMEKNNITRQGGEEPAKIRLHLVKPRGGILILTPVKATEEDNLYGLMNTIIKSNKKM